MKSIGENATILFRNMVLKIQLTEKNGSTLKSFTIIRFWAIN